MDQTINHSAAFLLPAAGRPGERDFLLPSRSPALFSAAAGLWRRGLEVVSILAACRYTHTTRQTLSGLLRCLLDDALRDLADALQSIRSCLVAHSCDEQSTTGATHERGRIIQELGIFSQGGGDG